MIELMPAYRLKEWQQPPVREQVPVPVPGPGQVLIRVSATGICHSDLHVLDAPPGAMNFDPPFTLGHEVAGTVARCGPGVTEWQVGDAVAVHGVWACGHCRMCLTGRENYCARPRSAVGAGLGTDGGLARYLLVPAERYLVHADGLDPVIVAPLTDAGLTSLHAINRSRRQLSADSVVVVIGVGGLGHLAVQILRAISAVTVVAVDNRAAAQELGRRCGATVATAGGDEAVAEVRGRTDGRGADLVLDFVGAAPTVAMAAQLLGADSDLTIIGGAGGELVVAKHAGLPPGCRVSLPFWGTRGELAEVLALARRGVIRPEVEVFAFAEVQEAYARLRSGSITGRAVVRAPLDDRPKLN